MATLSTGGETFDDSVRYMLDSILRDAEKPEQNEKLSLRDQYKILNALNEIVHEHPFDSVNRIREKPF